MSLALQTPTIQLLQRDWNTTLTLPGFSDSISRWTSSNPALAAKTIPEIIQLITQPQPAHQRLRDQALNCLLWHSSNPISQKAVLQSLLPQVIYLIDGNAKPSNLDLDEHAAHVVGLATEQIVHFNRHDVVCVHWWLYTSIRRELIRDVQARRRLLLQEQSASQDYLEACEQEREHCLLQAPAGDGSSDLDYLVELIAQVGRLDRQQAEIIVLTRTGTQSITGLAEQTGLSPDTLRKQRLRAENKLRQRADRHDLL